MIPGPSQPEPEVLATLSLPVLPHYGDEWKRILADTQSKLQTVFETKNEVILLPMAGQGAVEMAAENLIRKGEEAYVCSNGFFSLMIEQILDSRGARVKRVGTQLGEAVSPESLKGILDSFPKKEVQGRCLFVVHNETSTGVLNPAKDLLRVAKDRDMVTVLDSISSFGGIETKVDDWDTDFCIGYSSKAIGGVYGIVPVSISKECFEISRRNKDHITSKLLNLNVWREYIDEWSAWGHPHPTSMPTSTVVALNKALELVLKEGLGKRYARHGKAAEAMRKGLNRMNLDLFPNSDYLSNTVSVAKVDPSYEKQLRHSLLQKYEIMISGGLAELEGKIIRIGHMGTSAKLSNVLTTLGALGELFGELRKQ